MMYTVAEDTKWSCLLRLSCAPRLAGRVMTVEGLYENYLNQVTTLGALVHCFFSPPRRHCEVKRCLVSVHDNSMFSSLVTKVSVPINIIIITHARARVLSRMPLASYQCRWRSTECTHQLRAKHAPGIGNCSAEQGDEARYQKQDESCHSVR